MATWSDVEASAPQFARRVRDSFDAHTNKTIATLRRDGSPRISGTEVEFVDGQLWLGAMWRSRKAIDLQRDPRCAVHSGTGNGGESWTGDAKLSGTAVEITDSVRHKEISDASAGEAPPGPSHLFLIDIDEVVHTHVEGNRLVVELWTEGGGLRRMERK
ncbi:pyridoxamine 5'-phosphate oxidase family protein [Allokutzneria multivorans]|uniref:Pyridoxamine 5'-phosphate oxidase family protein n=1 Tax=Allokutzneria multivorans TaxID=1142134 RepID=A0ABP7TNV6_9PSEU